jgi:serine/threonine-protein kinase
MSVAYTVNGDSFVSGKPRLWTQTRMKLNGNLSTYDLAPDGKRLAAMLPNDGAGEQKPLTNLTFLLNFFDELRRRAPATGK